MTRLATPALGSGREPDEPADGVDLGRREVHGGARSVGTHAQRPSATCPTTHSSPNSGS